MNKTLLSLTAGLGLAIMASVARAQQPAPPVPSNPPATPATAPVGNGDYLLGRTYRVETVQGTTFTGTLISLSMARVEFEVPEMGKISLERTQIRRADLMGPAAVGVKPGYFDIGNGNRLFFAPTARGLRKGEATLQSVNLFLGGINYGITDYFSLGGYVSLIPGLFIDNQFLALTPKLSYPVSEKLHVGVGVLYVRVPDFDFGSSGSTGAGIGYGVVTLGGADNNLTLGLGYGFVQGDIGSTPVIQFGGQTRVSRRVSLISENYVLADARAGLGGLYGIKINWRRTSLGLGAMYAYAFPHDRTETYTYYDGTQFVTTTQTTHQGGGGFSTYIIPVYYDFTFRFGKGVK